jgi:hypothetical protein
VRGEVDPGRLRSYEKMQRERAHIEGRRHEKTKRFKQISVAARQRRKLGIDKKG